MASAPFRIESSVADGVQRLALVGELDLATAPELARRLDGIAATAVELDLAGVSFIDACGLRAVLRAHARWAGDGRPGLAVVGASRPVRRLFELAGVADHLADHPRPAAEPSPSDTT